MQRSGITWRKNHRASAGGAHTSDRPGIDHARGWEGKAQEGDCLMKGGKISIGGGCGCLCKGGFI